VAALVKMITTIAAAAIFQATDVLPGDLMFILPQPV
jgi:hypothetical protein